VIEKGRSLERGVTNSLQTGEIADVMERFGEAPFQIQVYRDLAVARYKLYDATGMWLQSRSVVAQTTFDQVVSVAREYLAETLLPSYFNRLRENPHAQPPRLNLKQANYVTRNFSLLPRQEQVEASAEFYRASLRTEDWIYSLKDGRIFAAENETGGYTLMLAEDY